MINIAIVGNGNIAQVHLEAIKLFSNRCKVVALADIYPDKAINLQEKFELQEAVCFASHQEMIASGVKIDLVHICTPPYVHAQIAIDCMQAGMNVLVEKPMAASVAECDEMLKVQKESGMLLSSVAQNRFRNSINKLKQVLDSGKAGKLRVAHVNSLWWRGHSYYDLWWRGLWEKEGGGPTLNHAVHHIDMINWIKGELPIEVSTMLANVMHDNSEVEDLSLSSLRYADNSIAQVTASVVHHGEEQGLVFQCEAAKIAAPWDCKANLPRPNGFPFEEMNTELINDLNSFYNSLPDLPYEGHIAQINDVLSSLENGTEPMITGEDGRKTIELIAAIYKAGATKTTVSLPLTKNDPFYTLDGLVANAIRFYKKSSAIKNFALEDIPTGTY